MSFMIPTMQVLAEDDMHVSQGYMPMSGGDSKCGVGAMPGSQYKLGVDRPRVASSYP